MVTEHLNATSGRGKFSPTFCNGHKIQMDKTKSVLDEIERAHRVTSDYDKWVPLNIAYIRKQKNISNMLQCKLQALLEYKKEMRKEYDYTRVLRLRSKGIRLKDLVFYV